MKTNAHKLTNFLIALVWLINGVICKIMNMVPRHEAIVARIVGTAHSRLLTVLIGISETLMALWIVSGISPRLNAVTQIAIIAAMNIIEFVKVPDLLLWGRLNAVFAFVMIAVIYINTFVPTLKTSTN